MNLHELGDKPERAHIAQNASTWDCTMNKRSEPQLVIPYTRTESSQALPRPSEYRKSKPAGLLCIGRGKKLCVHVHSSAGGMDAHAEYVCNQELSPCLQSYNQYGMPCMEITIQTCLIPQCRLLSVSG